MIATSKKTYFLCNQLDPLGPKIKATLTYKHSQFCNQPTYFTNLEKTNIDRNKYNTLDTTHTTYGTFCNTYPYMNDYFIS